MRHHALHDNVDHYCRPPPPSPRLGTGSVSVRTVTEDEGTEYTIMLPITGLCHSSRLQIRTVFNVILFDYLDTSYTEAKSNAFYSPYAFKLATPRLHHFNFNII